MKPRTKSNKELRDLQYLAKDVKETDLSQFVGNNTLYNKDKKLTFKFSKKSKKQLNEVLSSSGNEIFDDENTFFYKGHNNSCQGVAIRNTNLPDNSFLENGKPDPEAVRYILFTGKSKRLDRKKISDVFDQEKANDVLDKEGYSYSKFSFSREKIAAEKQRPSIFGTIVDDEPTPQKPSVWDEWDYSGSTKSNSL